MAQIPSCLSECSEITQFVEVFVHPWDCTLLSIAWQFEWILPSMSDLLDREVTPMSITNKTKTAVDKLQAFCFWGDAFLYKHQSTIYLSSPFLHEWSPKEKASSFYQHTLFLGIKVLQHVFSFSALPSFGMQTARVVFPLKLRQNCSRQTSFKKGWKLECTATLSLEPLCKTGRFS